MSIVDIIIKLIRYNLKIVFGNKFIYFILGSLAFFLFVTAINIFDVSNPGEDDIYYLMMFPGILLIFYPTAYGIQNDEDTRILEILFGIPNYRFKVWLVRLFLILGITFIILLFMAWLANLLIFPTNIWQMGYEIMYPIGFLSSFAFMLSTRVRNGNGTAVVMIIFGLFFWVSAGILQYSPWNLFLNPFSEPPSDMNEVVWSRTLFLNRIYLLVGMGLTLIYALMNMQKREKFV